MTPQDHEPVRDSQNGPFFALFLLDWAPKKPRLRLNERSAQGSNLSVFFILKKAKEEEFHCKEALLSFHSDKVPSCHLRDSITLIKGCICKRVSSMRTLFLPMHAVRKLFMLCMTMF